MRNFTALDTWNFKIDMIYDLTITKCKVTAGHDHGIKDKSSRLWNCQAFPHGFKGGTRLAQCILHIDIFIRSFVCSIYIPTFGNYNAAQSQKPMAHLYLYQQLRTSIRLHNIPYRCHHIECFICCSRWFPKSCSSQVASCTNNQCIILLAITWQQSTVCSQNKQKKRVRIHQHTFYKTQHSCNQEVHHTARWTKNRYPRGFFQTRNHAQENFHSPEDSTKRSIRRKASTMGTH